MERKKIALVSGGTYGIGRAITLTLAGLGFGVVAFGIDPAQGEGTREALRAAGREGEVLEADVTSGSDLGRVVEHTVRRFGHLDVLCNNAGARPVGTIMETSEAQWDLAFAVNIRGMFLLTKAALPHLIAASGGCIVNTASTSGYGGAGHIAYCAAKGAIIPFSKSLAIDHARDGIRVNVVVPGFTLTGMTEHWPPEILAIGRELSVARRLGQPQDIADAVAFLVSDAAKTISGAVLEVGSLPKAMAEAGPR
jgi:NAD(P)-dependent dehydrogenase (short-subunit alcohol dehydrogenase family)